MYPLISIKKGKLNLATLFLDEKRPSISMGYSPLCDFTTFEQQTIESIPIVGFHNQQLKLHIPNDAILQLTIDKQEFLIDKLKALGLVKERPGYLEIVLKPNALTFGGFKFGEFSVQFRFEAQPPPPEQLSIPPSKYWQGYLRQFDWQYLIIFCCMVITTFAFGTYLYGLPVPTPQREAVVNEVTFNFSRIIVPKEALNIPESSPMPAGGGVASGGASGGGAAKSGNANANLPIGRELLNKRIDNLLSRIDSRILDVNSKGAVGKSKGGGGTGTGDFSLLDKLTKNLDGGGGAPSRTLYNYESKSVETNKNIASIDSDRLRPTSNNQEAMDTGNANMVLRQAYGKIRACYEDALRFDRSLTGKLNMRFSINGQGRATNIELAPSDNLQDQGFLTCLEQVIGKLEFAPASRGTTPVQTSMIFTPNTAGNFK